MSLVTAYWRFRAEEVRTLADDMKDAKTKLIMAGVADDCERIAKLFENGTLKLQTSPLAGPTKNGESGRGRVQGSTAYLFSRRSPITRIAGPEQ
jgi:hypothetical protein